MPYTKAHKQQSREKILSSARQLFSTQGFDAVTVDQVMADCGMTRGAFYAHFDSKSALYNEALMFSAGHSRLGNPKPDSLDTRQWLLRQLDGYLSLEHVRGEQPCPLAFMANDITSRDPQTRQTYATAYQRMNSKLLELISSYTDADIAQVQSLTSLMIGAVAVARAMPDETMAQQHLDACRAQARRIFAQQSDQSIA